MKDYGGKNRHKKIRRKERVTEKNQMVQIVIREKIKCMRGKTCEGKNDGLLG